MLFLSICFPCAATLFKELSELERKNVQMVLTNLHRQHEDMPEGKKIGHVLIVTLKPFLPEEKILSWTNLFHVNTKDFIIKQDLSVKEGDVYHKDKVLISELKLRSNSIRSIAVIVPLVNPQNKSTHVDLLVLTKDIVSVGISNSFDYTADHLNSFNLSIGENNFLGLNQGIHVGYNLNQTAHEFYGKYYYPKIMQTKWSLSLKPGIVFLRNGFNYDGFFFDAKVKKAIDYKKNPWGFSLEISGESKTKEKFKGSKIDTIEVDETSKKSIKKSYKNKNYQWDVMFSRGIFPNKKDEQQIFFGHGLNIKNPQISSKQNLSSSEKIIFEEKVLPKREKESFLVLGYKFYQNQFLSLYDYDTLGLQENIRLGGYFKLSLDLSSKLIMSDHNFVRPLVSASYTKSFLKDGFVSLEGLAQTRFEKAFEDNVGSMKFSLVSPKLFDYLRLVHYTTFKSINSSRDNLSLSLGSSNGLRGVDSNYYNGDQAIKLNFEARSKGINLPYLALGFNAFYDTGAAFKEFKTSSLAHIIGVGLRGLFPQIDSEVFRIDVGYVMFGPSKKERSFVVSFGTGQAF